MFRDYAHRGDAFAGGRAEAAAMNMGAALQYSRSAGRQQRLVIDAVIVVDRVCLLLVGLVMVTSASLTSPSALTGDPFFHFERQLMSVLLGVTFGAALLFVPISIWQRFAPVALIGSFALLVLVLIPGIGHEVNGSRRWIRIGLLNFQPSEIARWLLLTYIAIYAVRHQTDFAAVPGLLQAARRAAGRGRAAAARAGLRRRGRALRHRHGRALRRRRAAARFPAGLRRRRRGIALLALTSAYRLQRLTPSSIPGRIRTTAASSSRSR